MIWFQWRLHVAPEDAEEAAHLLIENGCEGVQVDDTTLRFDKSEDATLLPASMAVITGYTHDLNAREQREKFETALRAAPFAGRLEMEMLDEADWANQWRENFPPLHIGPFVVAPSWEKVEADDHIPIRLDPGLAFGTGQHPTTQLCLELLPAALERVRESVPQSTPRLLDLGCGSGLLSVAAHKLGARVLASDLDPHCIAATRENALLNETDIHIVQGAGLDWLSPAHDGFDIIVANLMSDLLIQLAPWLYQALRTNGVLLVSGISSPRAAEVEAALQDCGMSTLERHARDGEERQDWTERWLAFLFTKNS